jgi:iron complex outermembrane receptor protein
MSVAILATLAGIAPGANAAAADSAEGSNTGQLEEIIVTAQKRSENLQSVPVTVSAITAATLKQTGGVSIQDLNALVPGLNMEAQGSYTLPAIRGVSTTLTTLGDEPNVAIYIDGVYYPVSFANFAYFNNIDRVEVLKGPQGTLFGRNATGGAINVITRDPSATPTADVMVGFGSYDEVLTSAYAAGPVNDVLKADFSFYSHIDHGWAENIFLDRHDGATDGYGARSKWVLTPTDSSKYTLSVDYSKENNAPANFTIGRDSPLTPFGAVVAGQLGQTSTNFEVTNPIYQIGVALTAEWNFSSFDMISVSGLRQGHADGHFDIDNTSFPTVGLWYGPKSRSASEDFRLQSKDSAANFTWVVGLNGYYDYDSYEPYNVLLSSGAFPEFATNNTAAEALYGQATQKLTDALRMTLGARLDSERVAVTSDEESYGLAHESFSHTWTDFSPKLGLDYQFGPKTLGYMSISKGFKGGAFNVGAVPPEKTPIDPETLWAYELGVKSDVTSHFRANAAAFYYDYKDIQVQAFGASAVAPLDNNAARARMIGSDGDLTWSYGGIFAAQDTFKATAGYAWLHSYYASYLGASFAQEQFTPQGVPAGDVITSVNATGNQLLDAPKFTFDLSLNYGFLTSIGRFSLTPTAYYNSGYYLDAANTPRFKQGSFTRLNATARWESVDAHYSVELVGRNLTNVKQLGGVLASSLGPAANGYPPSWYDIKFAYHY